MLKKQHITYLNVSTILCCFWWKKSLFSDVMSIKTITSVGALEQFTEKECIKMYIYPLIGTKIERCYRYFDLIVYLTSPKKLVIKASRRWRKKEKKQLLSDISKTVKKKTGSIFIVEAKHCTLKCSVCDSKTE